MANEIIRELPIANIARVELITDEVSPKTYRLIDVAEDAESTAFISQGEEKELRNRNTIKAQNNTEDIVKGYDLKLSSATLVPEILELVDGGELTYSDDPTNLIVDKYKAPALGRAVERKVFTTKIYTEVKDETGATVSYVCFTYVGLSLIHI